MSTQLRSWYLCLIFLVASCIKERERPVYSPFQPDNTGTGNPENQSPVAVISNDLDTVYLPYGKRLVLDGSQSSDPEKAKLRFGWRQLSGPTILVADDTTASLAFFEIPQQGTYVFELTVTDPAGAGAKDTATRVALFDQQCSPDRTVIQPKLELVTKSPLMYFFPVTRMAGSKLLFAGGYIRDPNDPDQWDVIHTPDVHTFDVTTRTWGLEKLSSARTPYWAASDGDLVAFAGGAERNDSGGLSKRIDIYHARNGTWRSIDMPHAAWHPAVALAGNRLVIGGGMDIHAQTTARADVYNIQTDTWTSHLLGEARTAMTVTSSDQKIYFAGGGSNGTTPVLSNVIDIYSVSTGQWTSARLDQPRSAMLGAAVGPYLVWAGGYTGSKATGQVEVMDLSANTTGRDCLFSVLENGTPNIRSLRVDDQTVCFLNGNEIYFYQPALRKWKAGVMDKSLLSIHVYLGKLYGVAEEDAGSRTRFAIYEVQY